MPPSVTYAFGSTLGGRGIGRIAGHAVEGADRAGLLDTAIAWAAEDVSIPDERLWTIPGGSYLDKALNLHYYLNDSLFDYVSRSVLDEPALFHGWNNMCLQCLRAVNQNGGTTVVERASSHPTTQRQLVEAEYESHGIDESIIDQRLYARAVTELTEADAIFVPSTFVYDSFLEQGFDEERLHLIPFGVDTDAFRPPDDLARPESEFTAVYVGAVSLRKGIQYLLPAWQAADLDGVLKIVGNVADAAESFVEEYREDPTIEFLGWVDDPAELYRDASVFVFPSIEEGSALVTYEAMASGLPSIVTPNTGSLVKDGVHGRVVPIRETEPLADSLSALADDPEKRREMGERARDTVEEYTWTAYGDRVAETYRQLLEE